MHLQSISLKPEAKRTESFPFALPVIRKLGTLKFSTPVTFFVGENGSGKSTLLEGIAAATALPNVGGAETARDESLEHARSLGKTLKLVWNGKRTHRGLFLRAEDFFGYARRLARLGKELEEEAEEYKKEMSGYGLDLAVGSTLGQRQALRTRYGGDLDERSHGESFLALFKARFVPGGLYLLDEPEAPLSPQRQLAFLFLLKEMVAQDAQFIIATHSPIIMAFPGATIIGFDALPPKPVAYDDLEHVRLTRNFLNNPEAYLRHIRDEE